MLDLWVEKMTDCNFLLVPKSKMGCLQQTIMTALCNWGLKSRWDICSRRKWQFCEMVKNIFNVKYHWQFSSIIWIIVFSNFLHWDAHCV